MAWILTFIFSKLLLVILKKKREQDSDSEQEQEQELYSSNQVEHVMRKGGNLDKECECRVRVRSELTSSG